MTKENVVNESVTKSEVFKRDLVCKLSEVEKVGKQAKDKINETEKTTVKKVKTIRKKNEKKS